MPQPEARGEQLVGTTVEILCEGPSKTNAARLTGRTRTNKIVVFEGDDAESASCCNLRDHARDRVQPFGRATEFEPVVLRPNSGDSAARRARFMIYHLSLHTVGLIAGVAPRWLGAARDSFAPTARARFRASRARAPPGALLLTIDFVWSFWLLATMEMGEFSNFRRPLLIILPVGYFPRPEICR